MTMKSNILYNVFSGLPMPVNTMASSPWCGIHWKTSSALCICLVVSLVWYLPKHTFCKVPHCNSNTQHWFTFSLPPPTQQNMNHLWIFSPSSSQLVLSLKSILSLLRMAIHHLCFLIFSLCHVCHILNTFKYTVFETAAFPLLSFVCGILLEQYETV
jgi:hypothetical protein